MTDRFKLLRGDEGLVALYIDDHVTVLTCLLISLEASVGSTAVVWASHDGFPSKVVYTFCDAGVVGGHENAVEHGTSLFADPLDDRFSSQHGQRLAGKARRGVARRYNGDEFHVCNILRFFGANW